MINVKISPSGLVWYVLDNDAHRDTHKGKRGAQHIAAGLRDGSLVYDPELDHTVPAAGDGCWYWPACMVGGVCTGQCEKLNPEQPDGDPLAAMLSELE